jgi:hypothetical protein
MITLADGRNKLTENLLSKTSLLFGLGTLSAWASYTNIGELVLKIALIPLGWGIILLLLYLVFKKIGWHWWG